MKFLTTKNDVVAVFGETSTHMIGLSEKKYEVVSIKKEGSQEFSYALDNQFKRGAKDYFDTIFGSIYGVCGKARSGKDTFAQAFLQRMDELDVPNVYETALANPIKAIEPYVFPLSANSSKKNREHLIFIGQTLRKGNENVWLCAWLSDAINTILHKQLLQGEFTSLITDIRQANEFEFFQSLGAFIIKIEAPIELREESLSTEGTALTTVTNTPTEDDIDYFHSQDILINNDYKTDFQEDLDKFL